MSLLIIVDEKSKYLMDLSHRHLVASELNSAILVNQCSDKDPK